MASPYGALIEHAHMPAVPTTGVQANSSLQRTIATNQVA